MLKINNLSAGYQDGKMILEHFNLELNEGERIGITGQNGNGKSTLAKAIMGMVPFMKGDIIWQGKSLKDLEPHVRCKLGIGYFMQGGRVFRNLTVDDNLKAAALHDNSLNIEAHLKQLNIYELPLLKDPKRRKILAGDLSGGERHILGFVLALLGCSNMKLLIADEPSAGLSQKMQAYLLEVIQSILLDESVGFMIIEQNVDFLNKTVKKTIQLKS
ncbi:MAG: ATP-binding cassette domain-containing protein [Saprospiraceae bacterium]|nr:ATP-binding cassette domain-containing protein [Candidatus Vicinibacter affinis]